MAGLVKHFTLGMLTGFVPIVLLSFYNGRMIKHDMDFALMSRCSPIVFGIIHTLLMVVAGAYGVTDYFVIGAIAGLIYAIYGCYEEVPEKLLKLENPQCHVIQSLVLWGIVYGVGLDFLYRNI